MLALLFLILMMAGLFRLTIFLFGLIGKLFGGLFSVAGYAQVNLRESGQEWK